MDRDRDSRRPLDIPPEDRYGTSRGQSYRPGARSPARADSYRARSPPRRPYVPPGRPRSRSPPPRIDSYRRRSPSPRDRFRDGRDVRGGDSYRARPRSPAPSRREELPRDDLFRRDPEGDYRGARAFRDERAAVRDDRAYPARSPPRYRERERSPLPLKRAREPSPVNSRGRRTPPPAKRERLASPQRPRYDEFPPSREESPSRRHEYARERTPPVRGVTRGYRRADSRSPIRRNEGVDPRAINDWRRPPARSPSPAPRAARPAYDDYDDRGRDSVATSRRSSPPVHPSRLGLQHADDRVARPAPRDTYDTREPYTRALRSPEPLRPRRDPTPPPAREPAYPDDRVHEQESRVPPPREAYRSEDISVRAPPTGPASGYRAPPNSMAPPSGPASAPISVSAHARTPTAPPSGPRGDAGTVPRGGFGAPRGRGGFGSDFAPRGGFGGDFAPRGGFGGDRGGFGGDHGPRGGFGGDYGPRGGFGGDHAPRGGFGNDFAPRGRGGAPFSQPSPGFRGGRGGGGLGRGQAFERDQPDYPLQQQGPPSGPRGSFSAQQQPVTPFRPSNNPTATTYPRSQRFAPNGQPIADPPTGPRGIATPSAPAAPPSRPSIPTGPSSSQAPPPPPGPHPALRNLPQVVPGGESMPPLIDRTRLDKITEETERLRKAIEVKEEKKRRALREWERHGRESEGAALRSELAEEAVRGFLVEEGVGAAF